MRIGARDPERRHGRTPWAPLSGPEFALVEQTHHTRRPVDPGGRYVRVQRCGQHTTSYGLDHLDQPRRTACGQGMSDVRLDRADPQWLAVALFTIGSKQCLSLDSITEWGSGTVRLYDILAVRVDRGIQQRRVG